ncbi:unnamed protein product [Meganyctiphanes norvegica]|uniref:C-type lectin domain-containing protein n=1 Tax=Meganyctiphanes norvegica TaxID=48144 RepID=A0AAV2RFI1_MEGNR
MSWLDSWSRCQSLGAQPFVPRTLRDFEVIKSVRLALGEQTALWLPASDLSQEGILKWWDGKDASGSQGLVWVGNQELHDNKEAHDCLMYGYPHGGVHMHVCSEHWYPMICYKN